MQNETKTRFFQQQLLNWYRPEDRPLPWKGIDNPYYIWLSEIILQQTRVEQGRDYYLRFINKYPQIEDLAAAPDDAVMKLWEGLGYYSRVRNLLTTARYITNELSGVFPNTYAGIKQLKGVGPYTAAAIASFAYNLPHAVVDGNVFRVLSRFFAIATPLDSTEGKKQFTALAESLLVPTQAALYNQAIMDFGATVCLPRAPKCAQCPMKEACAALHEQRIAELPFKSKKIAKSERHFHYFLFNYSGNIFIQKREKKDIWMHLYQFPLMESADLNWKRDTIHEQLLEAWNIKAQVQSGSKVFQQVLTHQIVKACFWEINLPELPKSVDPSWTLVAREELGKYAFPKVIDRYLGDNTIYLDLR